MRRGSQILKKENGDSCISHWALSPKQTSVPIYYVCRFLFYPRFLLCPRCARLLLTHRPGLRFESSITQARNRCCLAREMNSEVSDLSRMNAASVAYSFLMFYPSRAQDNIIFSKGGTPWVQNCM
jgi:hypothetical protein